MRCNAGFGDRTRGRPTLRSSASKITASRSEGNGSLSTSHSRGKLVESPAGKNAFFASRAIVPFTFGNPNRNGSHGSGVLTTHSTMCTSNTMVRGDLRGKTDQAAHDDPTDDADARSPVPLEVPEDVRRVPRRAVRPVRSLWKRRGKLNQGPTYIFEYGHVTAKQNIARYDSVGFRPPC